MKIFDFDKFLIFLLPIFFICTSLFFNLKILLLSTFLIIFILSYEFIIYKKNLLFGFKGLAFLTFPSIILSTFTIFISIPSIYVCYIYEFNHNTIPYFISILSFYIFYPIGLNTGFFIKNIDTKKLLKMKEKKIDLIDNYNINYEILLIVFSFSIFIIINYLIQIKEIPLFELIQNPGDYARLALLREQALKTLGLSSIEKYLFIWTRSLFLPFGIVGSLFLADNFNKRKYWILFWSFFLIGVFINSITLEKSPIATIFFIIVIYFYIKKNNISINNFLFYIVIVMFIPFLISFFLHFGKSNVFEVVINSLLYRIFIIPSEVLYQYFNIFPDLHDFLDGRSSQLFSWLHQDGTFPLSNYVAKIWWKDPFTSGSCNANYIGNFYADFGILGVFISTYIVGILTHLFYYKLLFVVAYKKNFLYVSSTAVVIPIFTFGFFSSNFTTLFITRGLVLLYLLFIFFHILRNNTIKHK